MKLALLFFLSINLFASNFHLALEKQDNIISVSFSYNDISSFNDTVLLTDYNLTVFQDDKVKLSLSPIEDDVIIATIYAEETQSFDLLVKNNQPIFLNQND